MATARKTSFRPSPVATPPPKPAPVPTPIQQARPSGVSQKPSPVVTAPPQVQPKQLDYGVTISAPTPPPPPPPKPTQEFRPSKAAAESALARLEREPQRVELPPTKMIPPVVSTETGPKLLVETKSGEIKKVTEPTAQKLAERGALSQQSTEEVKNIEKTIISSQPDLPGIPKIGVPASVPALLGGIIPLTAGAIPFQAKPQTEGEKQFTPTLEGFKAPTSKGGAEALDISEKVLSEEKFTIPETVTTREIPAVGEPTKETRQYIDPATGLLTTETKTTTPQPGVEIIKTGGESISQTIGIKPVKSDVSDPVGSLFMGATQSALNEYIGVKNIGALATGKEQEESYATPSGLLFGGLFEAGKVVAEDVAGGVFNIGRMAAGKTPVKAGEQVKTIGIAGDVITVEQKPVQGLGKAYTALEESGQRAARIAEADPFYALGDIAVQVPLLVVAPVKAASVALKGIGVAAKTVKGATQAGKASKLLSITGEKVTEIKPKTPIAKSYQQEYALGEAKVIQAEDIAKYGELAPERQAALTKSQRGQFELGVERLQEGKYGIGETTAEFTESGVTAAQRDIAKLRTTRITSEEISPALGAKIKELEKTGKQPDLFPEEIPTRVTADDILNPEGFKSTKIELGSGIGRFEKGGEDLFGGGKGLPPAEPPLPPRTVGDVIDSTAKLQGITKAEARRLLEETNQIPPSVSDKAVLKADFERTGEYTTTEFGLGRGSGSYLGDIGKVDDIYGAGVTTKVAKAVTKSDIDKFSAETKIPRDDAEKLFKKADEQYGSQGTQVLMENPELVTKQSQQLFELEKARTALKKTNASKAISSIEDQATQRKLSDLIKLEKAKKPSTSADLATQAALKKLIAEEKVKIASKVIPKIADEIDILRAKPRGLAGLAEEGVQVIRKPGSKLEAGIFGGVATGVGVGTAIGLGLQGEGVKPQVIQQDILFTPQVSRLERESLISFEKQFQEQPQIIKQQPKLTTRQEFVQKPDQTFRELFVQAPKVTTRKTAKATNVFDVTEQYKPIQETKTITNEELISQGLGFGLPRGGGSDVTPSGKAGRKFYRVFDIAKTPFGKIKYGLGTQVQSDAPIYEFEDVLPPKKRGSKTANEQFFSL